MVRLMRTVKLVDRKINDDLMEMMGLNETFNKMAKVLEYCGWEG